MNIILITKLKTTNIGNQALSDELIKLYRRSGSSFRVVGRPEGLFGYSLEKLKKSDDPVELLEKWVDRLLTHLNPLQGSTPFQPAIQNVQLLSFGDFKVKNDNLFQTIKNIFRNYVHSDALFANTYRSRFLTLASADMVIYSGAGEVGDNNIFLRQLLELRIAQKLGIRTFAINQSVEVVEQPMQAICAHVYKSMERILVRGIISRDNMVKMGVPESRINCCPDSALLNPTPTPEEVNHMRQRYAIQEPAVGINATKVAGDLDKWREVIEALESLRYHVYFISNDPFGDKSIGEEICKLTGINAILEFIPYKLYAALLANFEFVISCRLHTNELALTGGTPVLPIEGSHFKTKEVFELINYPIPVANTKDNDWHRQIIERINDIHFNSDSVRHFVDQLDKIRSQSEGNLVGNR